MRIVEADVWEVATEAVGRQPNRYGAAPILERVIVRLQDEDGNEGWGELLPLEYFTGETASVSAAVLREAVTRLKKQQSDDPLSVIDEMADFSSQKAARTGLEEAILDLKGKALGIPMSGLLGEEKRSEIFTYIGIGLLTPREAVERAQRFVDEGISTIKVKAGVDLEKDVQRVLAIRNTFGDGINIRIDANGGYSPQEALRFCEMLRDARIEHLEQPVRQDEKSRFEVFRRIREMGIPVAIDESLLSAEEALRFIEEDAVDVGVIKIIKFGGPIAARKVCAVFEAAGKSAVISSARESYIGKAASLALTLTLENGKKAHEFSLLPTEETFSNWRHQFAGGKVVWREGAGLGAWGNREGLEKFAR